MKSVQERIELLDQLGNDDLIIEHLLLEESEIVINYGLNLLESNGLKIENMNLLKSLDLKVQLLKSIKGEYYRIRGYEKLFDKSDCSNIVDGIIPSELKFGVEIEAVGEKHHMFKDFFTLDRWYIDNDLSLSGKGLEFVSPIMTYDRENLNQIYRVCNFLMDNDFFTNYLCGGHIHFSYKYLKEINELRNLLLLYSYFEKELYMISNNERNQLRSRITEYAGSFIPVLDQIEKFSKVYSGEDVFKDFSKSEGYIFKSKQRGLNIRNICDEKKNTVEFRIPNGTLEYDDWHKNIILYGSLMKLAKKISSNENDQSDFYDFISLGRRSFLKIEYFLDFLFEEERLKGEYYDRYSAHLKDPAIQELKLKEFKIDNYRSLINKG